MATDEKKFYTAVTRMESGVEPQKVADALDVSYATVLRWRREYQAAKEQGKLGELLDLDKLALEMTFEVAAGNATLSGEVLNPAIDDLAKNVNGLQSLQTQFQNTAVFLNQQIKSRAASLDHTSELVELTTALCSLQNAFFNKNSTQVNVQNNYGGENTKPYGNFLSDKPND
jgi:hypothetical protein